MEIVFFEYAKKALEEMDPQLRRFFLRHFGKIQKMPPRRHMKFGAPFNVENVTDQARIIYQIDGNKLFIMHCFTSHKEYERWYKSFI